MLCRASLKHVDSSGSGMVRPKKWYEKPMSLSSGVGEGMEWFELISAGSERFIVRSRRGVSFVARLATSLRSTPICHSDP